MPDEIHCTGANDGTDHTVVNELSTSVHLGRLTAHLASLDLDAPTLELLTAVLTINVSDPVEIVTAIRG
jgi:hypothetical protein